MDNILKLNGQLTGTNRKGYLKKKEPAVPMAGMSRSEGPDQPERVRNIKTKKGTETISKTDERGLSMWVRTGSRVGDDRRRVISPPIALRTRIAHGRGTACARKLRATSAHKPE